MQAIGSLARSSTNKSPQGGGYIGPPLLLTGFLAWTILMDCEGMALIPILVSARKLQTATFPKQLIRIGIERLQGFSMHRLFSQTTWESLPGERDIVADNGQTYH